MGKKTIRRAQSEDFEIFDDNVKVGTVRVKPNAILWKRRGKQSWVGVSIEHFAEYVEGHGTEKER